MAEVLTAGSNSRWELHPHKDGAAWDITGGTASVTFTRPDGSTTTKTATVTGGEAGAYYEGDTTLFLVDGAAIYGAWRFAWTATAGGKTIAYEGEDFLVVRA